MRLHRRLRRSRRRAGRPPGPVTGRPSPRPRPAAPARGGGPAACCAPVAGRCRTTMSAPRNGPRTGGPSATRPAACPAGSPRRPSDRRRTAGGTRTPWCRTAVESGQRGGIALRDLPHQGLVRDRPLVRGRRDRSGRARSHRQPQPIRHWHRIRTHVHHPVGSSVGPAGEDRPGPAGPRTRPTGCGASPSSAEPTAGQAGGPPTEPPRSRTPSTPSGRGVTSPGRAAPRSVCSRCRRHHR